MSSWRLSDHVKLQMVERQITEELIYETLAHPDTIVQGKGKRKIYQKIKSDKLIRVVTEQEIVITVYLTDKIKKYIKESTS